MVFQPFSDFSKFKMRRKRLLQSLKRKYGDKQGVVIIGAGFENERYSFRQESSFYYLTGINEPVAVLLMYLNGKETLYVPNFGNEREKWVKVGISTKSRPDFFGFDEIRHLSDPVKGYSYTPFCNNDYYATLLKDLSSYLDKDVAVYSLLSGTPGYFEHVQRFDGWQREIPLLAKVRKDISPLVHHQRRIKEPDELELIQRAVDITVEAQKKAAQIIQCGKYEYEIQAEIEHTFIKLGADRPSFPSIVATGKNSTVLHYVQKSGQLKDEDLVVIDIGAEYGNYAADLTRTYPVNGTFTQRQKEVYDIVLQTQEYIASIAKPGMFIRNPDQKEGSLHYHAAKFLERCGYAQYFPHGIGHYLGLDVHDVGDYTLPLEVGDVFTIEPGIYIPSEEIGIRIEDDYVMKEEGAECLSAQLSK